MAGWYILPVLNYDTSSPPLCADGGGWQAGTSSLSSTMTPAHLLSVQVVEDETMVEGLDWYILPVLNPDTSSPPLCAGGGG